MALCRNNRFGILWVVLEKKAKKRRANVFWQDLEIDLVEQLRRKVFYATGN